VAAARNSPADRRRAGADAQSRTGRKRGAWKSFKPGAPLVEPEVRRSSNGVLETTLRMRYAWKHIGGYRLYMRTYEGTIPGPTLRVKPGDTLRIKLVNDLPPNRDRRRQTIRSHTSSTPPTSTRTVCT
jgi:FtsP/CotA-like multicopper oxidase with cupredoxin domain